MGHVVELRGRRVGGREAINMKTSPEGIAADSADAMLGPNPFVGFRTKDVFREAVRAIRLAAVQPRLTARVVGELATEMSRIFKDESELRPQPRDRRFSDPAWLDRAGYRRWLQSYLAAERVLGEWIKQQKLADHSRARLAFMTGLMIDAVAPSNFPWQPEAVRRFQESGGHSALDGVKNLVRDLRENRGLPAQVDKTQFELGRNIANTPGVVIFRNEVIELIQYTPMTAEVREVPILFIPPQINKYYIFDLASEKSVVRAALEAGFQVFMISWRNPGPEHADWGLAEYAAAIDMSVSAICNLTRANRVNLFGACAGGITVAAYVAARSAARDPRVNSLTLVVSVLDVRSIGDTPLGLFATPRAIKTARRKSQTAGVLDGKAMASAFAWLRPNDLIWNYWVNNVLLGNKPPSFDLLYWNNDNTRLPARLHGEFMDMFLNNSMAHPGRLRLHGVPVDLGRVTCDSYLLGGTTDHITPWKACYRNTQLLGGKRTFVLSNAGHMQSILNPPGTKKAEFWTEGALDPDPEAWRKSAQHQSGSWWPHWHAWLHERSGSLRPAPAQLGSADYPELGKAPGSYVLVV
ncbi:MAG: alpha/beta fold hydrolase [Nevskia sp.]|nr:alpha/beta fold hydrolase [Nevskia sp.]